MANEKEGATTDKAWKAHYLPKPNRFFCYLISIELVTEIEYNLRYPSPGSMVDQIQSSSFYLPIPTSVSPKLPSFLDVEHTILLPIV